MENIPKVVEMMDKDFVTLTPEMQIGDAVELLMEERMTGIIVIDADKKPVGVLSERDCLKVLLLDSFHGTPDSQVKHYMVSDLVTVDSQLDIISAAQILIESHFRRLPVVDGGKLVGQITRRDILRGMRKFNALLRGSR